MVDSIGTLLHRTVEDKHLSIQEWDPVIKEALLKDWDKGVQELNQFLGEALVHPQWVFDEEVLERLERNTDHGVNGEAVEEIQERQKYGEEAKRIAGVLNQAMGADKLFTEPEWETVASQIKEAWDEGGRLAIALCLDQMAEEGASLEPKLRARIQERLVDEGFLRQELLTAVGAPKKTDEPEKLDQPKPTKEPIVSDSPFLKQEPAMASVAVEATLLQRVTDAKDDPVLLFNAQIALGHFYGMTLKEYDKGIKAYRVALTQEVALPVGFVGPLFLLAVKQSTLSLYECWLKENLWSPEVDRYRAEALQAVDQILDSLPKTASRKPFEQIRDEIQKIRLPLQGVTGPVAATPSASVQSEVESLKLSYSLFGKVVYDYQKRYPKLSGSLTLKLIVPSEDQAGPFRTGFEVDGSAIQGVPADVREQFLHDISVSLQENFFLERLHQEGKQPAVVTVGFPLWSASEIFPSGGVTPGEEGTAKALRDECRWLLQQADENGAIPAILNGLDQLYQRGRDLFLKSKDPSEQAECRLLFGTILGKKADIYASVGDFEPAIEAYEMALKFPDETVFLRTRIEEGLLKAFKGQILEAYGPHQWELRTKALARCDALIATASKQGRRT
ncbi:MAG: hypothetical protein Q7S00_08280, partial [bacterium]|nr:hypothetical protein [bacterium]